MAMLYSNYVIGEGSLIMTFDGGDPEDVNKEVVKSGRKVGEIKTATFISLISNVLL